MFNVANFLNNLRKHYGIEKITEVQFTRYSKLSFAHWHKSWKVKLDNDYFDVHVETRSKHHKDALTLCYQI